MNSVCNSDPYWLVVSLKHFFLPGQIAADSISISRDTLLVLITLICGVK